MSKLLAITQKLEKERSIVTDQTLRENMDKAIQILHGILLTLEAQSTWPESRKWYVGDPFNGESTRVSEK